MKISTAILGMGLLLSAASAFAQNTPDEPLVVPMLKVVYDCGDCIPNKPAEVQLLAAYINEATSNGFKIDDQHTATLRITNYNERGWTTRNLFGPLAGGDRVEGTLIWRDRTVNVGDSAHAWFHGIDNPARNVGEEAFSKIQKIAEQANSRT